MRLGLQVGCASRDTFIWPQRDGPETGPPNSDVYSPDQSLEAAEVGWVEVRGVVTVHQRFSLGVLSESGECHDVRR